MQLVYRLLLRCRVRNERARQVGLAVLHVGDLRRVRRGRCVEAVQQLGLHGLLPVDLLLQLLVLHCFCACSRSNVVGFEKCRHLQEHLNGSPDATLPPLSCHSYARLMGWRLLSVGMTA